MKKKSGGSRKGAGRKPLPLSEKKSTLKLYLKNSVIESLGGEEFLKEKIVIHIQDLLIKSVKKNAIPLISVKTGFGKIVNPLNDKGKVYDVWKELYTENAHGNRFRYTDKEGKEVDKMINGVEVYDHTTGEFWTVKSDLRKATQEEIDSIK